MPASNIKVFLRVRPSAAPFPGFSSIPEEGIVAFEQEQERDASSLRVSYTVDNNKARHRFKFDGILPMTVNQEQVFNIVAKPVIEDVLQGINGTIFAYGQTGSGKTFTITGGSEKYSDRGLIPRCISYLFQSFQSCGGRTNYQLAVSYLEIYNNDGYDLLMDGRDARKLEDLPKVRLVEDEDGNMHLRNLSVFPVQAEDDALNHLFVGDTNRVVAETPMNDASTRSHCMFILWAQSTEAGSSNTRRAKLHLVDLAGSERVSKTGVTGALQKEAVNINLSLHYLGQVIEALHNRSTGSQGHGHVPYRNSLMTSVLRDSLGGNCKTVMIGAIAVEKSNIDESISTCRFATRVASIKNNASINEELDPALLIKKLKKEVESLKGELKLLSGDEETQELGEADITDCSKLVTEYLEEPDPEAPFVCDSGLRFRECFRILRDTYWQQPGLENVSGSASQAHASKSAIGSSTGTDVAMGSLEAEVLQLRARVDHRDQEIGMLVNSLKNRSKGKEAQAALKNGPVFIKSSGSRSGVTPQGDGEQGAETSSGLAGNTASSGSRAVASTAASGDAQASTGGGSALLDRNQAFEVFRKSVRRTESMEESKTEMLQLVQEAQGLGEKANAVRTAREHVKVRVEKARMERAMQSSPKCPNDMTAPPDSPEVVAMLQEMAEHKRMFLQHSDRLKEVKVQIDKFQRSQAENAQRLQRDFENWYATYETQQGSVGHAASRSAASGQGPIATQRSYPAPASPPPEPPYRPSLQNSSSLQSSEAYSSARASPEPAPQQQVRQAASVSAASSDQPRPFTDAWAPPPNASAASSSSRRSPNQSQSGAPPRPPSIQAAPSAIVAPSATAGITVASPAGGSSAGVKTGDAETDDTIAAFYAAMAELGR